MNGRTRPSIADQPSRSWASRSLPGAALAAALLAPSWLGACEACRNALAEDPAARGFSIGIYLSIVVMLGMVFTLVIGLVTYMLRQARLADEENAKSTHP